MKFHKVIFFLFLLCAQFLSNLALESKEEKNAINLKWNDHSRENDVKHDELVLSKASRGKGASGGQDTRPVDNKKSKATSMLIKPYGYVSSICIGAIVVSMIIASDF
ncbi:uncharacterized protein [Rutidosis leptorrhynchoides]|uniref:uncharacterized protein n=1 Tax=Rutidosis leptorrhynchoides TaxID=125765 RepID=UPI003A999D34